MSYIFKADISFLSVTAKERVTYTYYLSYYPLNVDIINVIDERIKKAETEYVINELKEAREIVEHTSWHYNSVYGLGTFECPLYMKRGKVIITRHPLETRINCLC